MIKRLVICIAAVMLTCISICLPARADEVDGKIEINYSCGDIKLEGAGIAIYKAADAVLTDNTIVYSLVNELSSYSMKNEYGRETYFDGMTAAKSNEAAKKFANEKLTVVNSGKTDKNGNCSFSGLEPGMYLIKQISSTGISSKYSTFEPFLVAVPQVDEEKNYDFEISVKPKTEVESIPETTSAVETPAETTTPGSPILGIEDHSGVLYIAFAVMAGCLFLSGIWYVIAIFAKKKH